MQVRGAVLHHSPVERPYAQSRPLSVETVTLGDPGPGEVLVRMKAAGLCHSDLSVINGDRLRPVPMLLGHEAAGVVERCGPGVDDLSPGEHVVMVFVPACGSCSPCADGRPALCEPGIEANVAGSLLSGARRISGKAGTIHHHLGVSGFAEAAVVSRRSIVKVPDDLPFSIAALFGCAVLTGMGAVVNTAALRPGDRVAVVGLGGVGLAAVIGAIAAGAREVIGFDINAQKREFAASIGATAVFDAASPDAAEAAKEHTRGGVDIAVETAGVAPALALALDVTRRGGQTVTVSLPNPATRLDLAPLRLVTEERTLRGSFLGGGVPSRDIPRYIALYRAGRLPVDKLHSGTSPLEHINEGFDQLDRGEAVRHLIRFDG